MPGTGLHMCIFSAWEEDGELLVRGLGLATYREEHTTDCLAYGRAPGLTSAGVGSRPCDDQLI